MAARRRTPPHDLEAEESLLGAMLLSRDAIDAATNTPGITAAAFYKPTHGYIYDAIIGLRARGTPVDLTTTAGALADAGYLDHAGGRAELLRLQLGTPASANAAAYATRTAELAYQRHLLALSSDLQEAVYEGLDPAPVLERFAPTTLGSSTWTPVDLAPILSSNLEAPQPSCLARTDTRCLLYPGRVHTFQGESESLKSWLALVAATQEITEGRHCLYLDFEDSPQSILARLLALGASPVDIMTWFIYARPLAALDLGAAHRLEHLVRSARPSLAVIDGVTEAMSIEGYDLLDNKDVAAWLHHLPRRLADLGPAVAMIDHVTKSKEERGRYALGAQHKLAGIDGAAYNVEAVHPLARLPEGATDPVTGIAKISVSKDRPGAVRGYAAHNKHVGELHITAYPDGHLQARIEPAQEWAPGGFRPTHLMERVSEFLERHGAEGLSKRAIRGAIKGKAEAKDLAIELLVAEGYVGLHLGPNRAQLHRSLRPYREAEDADAATSAEGSPNGQRQLGPPPEEPPEDDQEPWEPDPFDWGAPTLQPTPPAPPHTEEPF